VSSNIQAFLNRMIRSQNVKHFADVVEGMDFPFMLEIEARRYVIQSRRQALVALTRRGTVLPDWTTMRTLCQVKAIEPPRQGRFRVVAELRSVDALGRIVRRSYALYYLHQHDGSYRIEMMQLSRKHLLRWPVRPVSARDLSPAMFA
jgi:hypothetical protein